MTKPEPTEDILEAFMRAKRKTNTSQKEPSAVTAGQETNEKPGTKIKKRETDHSQEKQFAAIAEQETDAAQSTTARKRTKGLPLEKTEAKKQKRGEQITSFNEILDFLTNKERAIAYINSIDPSALLQAGSQEFLNNYYSDSGEASEKLLAILQAFKESNPPQHFLSAINYQRVSPLNILFLIKSLPEVLNNGDKPSGIARSLCGLISSLRTIESFNPETPEFVNEIYKSGAFKEIRTMQHDKGMLTREQYGWLKEIFYNEETKAWNADNLGNFTLMMSGSGMFDQEEYISLKGNPKFYENGVWNAKSVSAYKYEIFFDTLKDLGNKDKALGLIEGIDVNALDEKFNSFLAEFKKYYSDSGEVSEKLRAKLDAFGEIKNQNFLKAVSRAFIKDKNMALPHFLCVVASIPEDAENKPAVASAICGMINREGALKTFTPDSPVILAEILGKLKDNFSNFTGLRVGKGMMSREEYDSTDLGKMLKTGAEERKEAKEENLEEFKTLLNQLRTKEKGLEFIEKIYPKVGEEDQKYLRDNFINRYYSGHDPESLDDLNETLDAITKADPSSHFLEVVLNKKQPEPFNLLCVIDAISAGAKDKDKKNVAKSLCAMVSTIKTLKSFDRESPKLVEKLCDLDILTTISSMMIGGGIISRDQYKELEGAFGDLKLPKNKELFRLSMSLQARIGMPSAGDLEGLKTLFGKEVVGREEAMHEKTMHEKAMHEKAMHKKAKGGLEGFKGHTKNKKGSRSIASFLNYMKNQYALETNNAASLLTPDSFETNLADNELTPAPQTIATSSSWPLEPPTTTTSSSWPLAQQTQEETWAGRVSANRKSFVRKGKTSR